MNKTETLIKEIDKALIEKGKNYMTLGRANKLLFDKNLISEHEKKNQYLKKLLESGAIKNAKQTERSPRQWRIFLTNHNLKNNTKIKSETKKTQTKGKGNEIGNTTFNKNDMTLKKQDWNKIIIIGFIVLFGLLGIIKSNNDEYDSDPILAYNYARDFIKEQLKAPSTAEFPGSFEKKDHVSNLGDGEYLIQSWVDSQNSFGATIRSRWSCKIIITKDRVQAKDIWIE